MAFFMESTFIAVMFFGWGRVSKRFHLVATWLTAIGSNLSALWILVANSWMQHPAGMHFNPETARNEMHNFWDVLLSPVSVNKFIHTITSGYVLASIVMIGISAWYVLKGRHIWMAKRSVLMASVFGFIALIVVVITGDGSAYQVAQKQPMKLAAMEGLYEGRQGAGLVAVGVLKPRVQPLDSGEAFLFKMEVPRLLSWLGYHDTEAFVPGVNDVLRGGYQYDTPDGETVVEPSVEEKIGMGRAAIEALRDFTDYRMQGDTAGMEEARERLEANFRYFGYGYLNSPESVVPNVPLTFYAFHTMVALGGLFFVFFAVVLYLSLRDRVAKRWLLITSIIMVGGGRGWASALDYSGYSAHYGGGISY